jgi:hypothetical protein
MRDGFDTISIYGAVAGPSDYSDGLASFREYRYAIERRLESSLPLLYSGGRFHSWL